MSKNNEIALQLVNNSQIDIALSLFPNVNNTNFAPSQTEVTVEGQYYDIGSDTFFLDEQIDVIQTNKKTGQSVFLTIPYTGTPEGSGFFASDDFVNFCINWFPQSGNGYAFGSAPDITFYSDIFEYGNLIIPEG